MKKNYKEGVLFGLFEYLLVKKMPMLDMRHRLELLFSVSPPLFDHDLCSVSGASLSWVGRSPAHVGDEEHDTERDAKSADDDVADGKEVVGAAENVRC